ncbi:MAG: glycosyltransferase family 4 protein, partial [Planctomycetes bacterium]|nr:glycosyltransferase family 4 protein [Planctomycetota bacterium]
VRVQGSGFGKQTRSMVFFAGLVEEPMKGFDVLHQACELLWQRRHDFELVATGDPAGQVDAFTRFVGWLNQAELPRHLRAADICVFPSIAQEALGRTAVEAMGVGRPVIASRLGGLPFTVPDGATGLLCEPGDPQDLAEKIATLFDDPALRERLGLAGRRRFEQHYAWPVIIDRHYRPLLTRRTRERPVPRTYRPFIAERVDQETLVSDVAEFFALDRHEIKKRLDRSRSLHESKRYERTLGELKTLCFEEAFVLYVLLECMRPRTIVEMGTQYGKSARRIIDIKALLGLESRVVCFDVADEVRYFSSGEAELVLKDVTGTVRRDILEAYEPDLIFVDIHLYHLLQEIVVETTSFGHSCALAIHDCGRGLCNPHMTIAKDDPGVTSLTGVWERHILAELFHVEDPLSSRLDNVENSTHRLRIFDTPHGLGVILPTWKKHGNRTGSTDLR